MSKKVLSEDELQNVNGGDCSTPASQCIKCGSTNITWQEEGYNFMDCVCNDCGKHWLKDDFGVIKEYN